eukprot:gene13814-biopygen2024
MAVPQRARPGRARWRDAVALRNTPPPSPTPPLMLRGVTFEIAASLSSARGWLMTWFPTPAAEAIQLGGGFGACPGASPGGVPACRCCAHPVPQTPLTLPDARGVRRGISGTSIVCCGLALREPAHPSPALPPPTPRTRVWVDVDFGGDLGCHRAPGLPGDSFGEIVSRAGVGNVVCAAVLWRGERFALGDSADCLPVDGCFHRLIVVPQNGLSGGGRKVATAYPTPAATPAAGSGAVAGAGAMLLDDRDGAAVLSTCVGGSTNPSHRAPGKQAPDDPLRKNRTADNPVPSGHTLEGAVQGCYICKCTSQNKCAQPHGLKFPTCPFAVMSHSSGKIDWDRSRASFEEWRNLPETQRVADPPSQIRDGRDCGNLPKIRQRAPSETEKDLKAVVAALSKSRRRLKLRVIDRLDCPAAREWNDRARRCGFATGASNPPQGVSWQDPTARGELAGSWGLLWVQRSPRRRHDPVRPRRIPLALAPIRPRSSAFLNSDQIPSNSWGWYPGDVAPVALTKHLHAGQSLVHGHCHLRRSVGRGLALSCTAPTPSTPTSSLSSPPPPAPPSTSDKTHRANPSNWRAGWEVGREGGWVVGRHVGWEGGRVQGGAPILTGTSLLLLTGEGRSGRKVRGADGWGGGLDGRRRVWVSCEVTKVSEACALRAPVLEQRPVQ